MKKNKIKIGQCYEYKDHVYEVVDKFDSKYWQVKDTLTKEYNYISTFTLLSMRKPFPNFS